MRAAKRGSRMIGVPRTVSAVATRRRRSKYRLLRGTSAENARSFSSRNFA